MVNIVNFKRQSDTKSDKLAEFIADDRFIVLKYNEDMKVDILTNFEPGLAELTLTQAAYVYMLTQLSENV